MMDLQEAKRIFAAFEREGVLDGIRVRVATPRMLYRMKKDTVRPQDRLDAEIMRRQFGLTEE